MSSNDIHGIESGWSVKSLDGHGVGSVEETTDRYILVKSGLINASHHYLPAVSLEHVRPELKEIGISLTRAEIDEGDWSEPPAEGPRVKGAPLNVDSDAEIDDVMRATMPAGPERPNEDIVSRA
ncbi:MAG: hypothetical protein M3153_05785 [Chloroflexota bacterium]|nr:hypothetical protein [Chloroflexota bacterium]